MAAGNFILYDEYKKYQFVNKLDLEADSIFVALMSASYTPQVATDTVFGTTGGTGIWDGQISHASYNSGAGGHALTSPSVTEISAPSGDWKFSSSNWALTFTSTNSPAIKYAVFRFNATIDSVVNPLIGYFELESGSTVTVLAGNTLTLQTPANGWYRWNGARS
jgi:hypothetical protein